MLGEIAGRGNRKINPRRGRPCAANAPAPHTASSPHSPRAGAAPEPKPCRRPNSHFFDDLSRLMTDAAGLADGAKREAQTFARSQMERMMAGMNVVAREEFEAVKEMAAKAREREREACRKGGRARGEAQRAKALIGLAFR